MSDQSKNIYLRFGIDAKKHETDKAVLFVVNNANVWLPKSQILNIVEEEYEGTQTVAVTIPLWLAEKNHLEDFCDPAWVSAGCPD